jgi:hypothetical protein
MCGVPRTARVKTARLGGVRAPIRNEMDSLHSTRVDRAALNSLFNLDIHSSQSCSVCTRPVCLSACLPGPACQCPSHQVGGEAARVSTADYRATVLRKGLRRPHFISALFTVQPFAAIPRTWFDSRNKCAEPRLGSAHVRPVWTAAALRETSYWRWRAPDAPEHWLRAGTYLDTPPRGLLVALGLHAGSGWPARPSPTGKRQETQCPHLYPFGAPLRWYLVLRAEPLLQCMPPV